MATRDVLAIGTSAGGVEALRFLARSFPRDFPASLLVVIHLSSHFHSTLDEILTHSGPLRASFAEDGETLERGRIYLAPPATHLLLQGDRLTLGQGPRENSARPAIDPLFRSVGLSCGSRAIGAVLTGTLGDGSAGLWALKQCGGLTVVQEPGDAAYPEMPITALRRSKPDHVVTLANMPKLFEQFVQQPAAAPVPCPDEIKYEVEIAKGGPSEMKTMDRIGRRSVLTCPDCHGVMWEIDEDELVRYRCHVGHGYSSELMEIALNENLQRALGSALRALDERLALAQKLEAQAGEQSHSRLAATWAEKVKEYSREATVLRDGIRRFDEMAARYARGAKHSAGG